MTEYFYQCSHRYRNRKREARSKQDFDCRCNAPIWVGTPPVHSHTRPAATPTKQQAIGPTRASYQIAIRTPLAVLVKWAAGMDGLVNV